MEEIMTKQQPKLSCGLDSINNKIVETASMQLAMPMIVNKSIKEGIVPLIYKKARIVPLYKKGSANECGNYRPVSLLPSLSKILGKAVFRQLMIYLETYQLLCKDQFGFRKMSQTSHVVQSMLNTIRALGLHSSTHLVVDSADDWPEPDDGLMRLGLWGAN